MREISCILGVISQPGARHTMWHLFSVNVLIIVLDVGLLITEYLGLRIFEQTFKCVVYSIKLKLEFAILGKLVSMVRREDRVYIDQSGQGRQSDRPVEHAVSESCTKLANGNITPVPSGLKCEDPFALHIELDSCTVSGKTI